LSLLVGAVFAVTFVASATGSAGAAETCPNSQLRAQQEATYLPGCRAFEMVSPPFKAYQDITRTSSRSRSAPSGDRVTFGSTGAFAGAIGAPSVIQYLTERGINGWTTKALSPEQKTNAGSNLADSDFFEFSPDLSQSVLRTAEPSPVVGAPSNVVNLFTRDNLLDHYSVATPAKPPGATQSTEALFPEYAAASSDFSHVLFQSQGAFTSDAPVNENAKLYESFEGEISLVSKLENGEPAPDNAVPGQSASVGGWLGGGFGIKTAMSDDGRRIYFANTTSFRPGQIYRRLDGTSTTEVTRSEATPPGTPAPALFWRASADGTKALFSTAEAMVTGDIDGTAGSRLYMYTDSGDPVNDANLTLLSVDDESSDGSNPEVLGVIESSEDMSSVYFIANNQLVSGADTSPGPKLYLWQGGSLRYLANLSGSNLVGLADETVRRLAYVTPDGLHLLFRGRASNGAGLADPGFEHDQVYLYDAVADHLRCISCAPGGSTGTAEFHIGGQGANSREFAYRPRAVSLDGSRAFFHTNQALSPRDSNGRIDVYEWHDDGTPDGAVSLISSGRAASNSYFEDATPSGDDVFITTRQPMVGWDNDNNADLYDARVGGGFPEPPPVAPECSGEACQGTSSSSPAALAPPASTAVSGPGNVRRHQHRAKKKKHCPRGKERRGKRCVAKRADHRRTANHNQGGAK
jgi:hypothetical protein